MFLRQACCIFETAKNSIISKWSDGKLQCFCYQTLLCFHLVALYLMILTARFPWEMVAWFGSHIFSSINCRQVDVKKATPKPDGIGGLRGGRGARGGRGRGRGGRDSRVKGKGEQAGVPWKTRCFKLCTFSCIFFLNFFTFSCKC